MSNICSRSSGVIVFLVLVLEQFVIFDSKRARADLSVTGY